MTVAIRIKEIAAEITSDPRARQVALAMIKYREDCLYLASEIAEAGASRFAPAEDGGPWPIMLNGPSLQAEITDQQEVWGCPAVCLYKTVKGEIVLHSGNAKWDFSGLDIDWEAMGDDASALQWDDASLIEFDPCGDVVILQGNTPQEAYEMADFISDEMLAHPDAYRDDEDVHLVGLAAKYWCQYKRDEAGPDNPNRNRRGIRGRGAARFFAGDNHSRHEMRSAYDSFATITDWECGCYYISGPSGVEPHTCDKHNNLPPQNKIFWVCGRAFADEECLKRVGRFLSENRLLVQGSIITGTRRPDKLYRMPELEAVLEILGSDRYRGKIPLDDFLTW